MTAADQTLRHLVAWGLPGGPEEPLDLDGVQGLTRLSAWHRVTGVVLEALADGAATGIGDDLIESLEEQHRRILHQSLAAEADLVWVTDRYREAGIEFRVLKGCATAHLDHDDPALRTTSDVDLLVRHHDFRRASDLLAAVNDRQAPPPDLRPDWNDRYARERAVKIVDGAWIDIHQTLVAGYWGMSIDHDALFEDPSDFEVAGRRLLGLGANDRFAHAVIHAGFSSVVRIQSFRDVAVLAARHDVSPVDILNDARWRPISGLLGRGIERTATLLPMAPELIEWAGSVRPRRRESMAFRTLKGGDGGSYYRSGPLALPPWQWPRYLYPIVIPSQEYLDWHGRSRIDHFGRALPRWRRRP